MHGDLATQQHATLAVLRAADDPDPVMGAPGDEEALLGAVGPVDEAELDEAESKLAPGDTGAEPGAGERERMRAERRRIDQLLVEAVLEEGLGGPRHKALEAYLITYAVRILKYLLANGEIVTRAARLGRPPVPAEAWLDFTDDDRQEFAHEMVATALNGFTKAVFEDRRWTPERGASLKTYFVNACILRYARLQAQWLGHRQTVRPAGLDFNPDAFGSGPDPAVAAATRDEADRMLAKIKDPQLREVLVLRSLGWTAEGAARRVGLTPKAAESRLARARKELRDEGAGTEPPSGGQSDTTQGGG